MTDREKEVYRWLLKCPEAPCIFGVVCPYDKYGYKNCIRHLMSDAAGIIRSLSSLRKD